MEQAQEAKWSFHAIEMTIQSLLESMSDLEGDELTAMEAELDASLVQLGDAEAAKADAIAWVLAQLEAKAEAIGITMAGMANRRASLLRQAERLRAHTLKIMQVVGLQKLSGISATLSVAKGRQSVQLTVPAEELPFKYQRAKIEADKEALAKDLKAKVNVEGAALVQGPDTLMIRR